MRTQTWVVLRQQWRGAGPLLIASLVLSVIETLLLIPTALIVRHVFDHLIPAHDASAILLAGAEILGLYLLSSAVGLLIRYLVLVMTKRLIAQLREALITRVLTLPRAYFDRQSLGTLQSTIVQDSERLDVMSSSVIAEVLPAAVIATGLSVVMLVLNWFLFIVLLAVVPVLIATGKLLGRQVRIRYRAWQRAFDTFSTQIHLALRAITLMKASGTERHVIARRVAEIRELSRAGREMVWRQDSHELVQAAVAASAGVVVLVVGGSAVARNTMTIGQLLSFYALLALLLRQVNVMLTALPVLIGGYESLARLVALLQRDDEEPYRGSRPIQFRGQLTLEQVSFGYDQQPILHQVTLELPAGGRAAIVGPNGAGKSTLVSLMLGLYRPQSGRLLADGVPFDELDLGVLRQSVGVLLQEPLLFPTTIRENISYGRPDASLEEVREAACWATADEFIELMPEGYDSLVGDDGALLSGGQRQRIALARALLSRPAMLILDEPTTHLDDRSVARLLENLRDFPGCPSIVTVTHDPEVAAISDLVYRIRDGRIATEAAARPESLETEAAQT